MSIWRLRHRVAFFVLAVLLWVLAGLPALAQSGALSAGPEGLVNGPYRAGAVLEVYVRADCPHCTAAKAYLPTFVALRPGLRVVLHAVDEDAAARDALSRLAREGGFWPPGVPTFVYRGRVLVGFSDAAQSGPELARLVDDAGALPTSADVAQPAASAPGSAGRINAGRWGVLSAAELGLPLFTLAVGLLDGFNPCAMWVLLFLLSLLVRLHDRRRMLLIAGTFVLVSGAVYYAFMAAWLNVFLAVGLTAALRNALALLAFVIGALNIKDFVIGLRGPTLSIPDAAKPGLYARMRSVMLARSLPLALLGVAGLAVAVNFIELLCTAGLPAMYTAILAQQDLAPAAHYGYLLLYILGYVADDSVMVGTAVFALSQGKLDEGTGRSLKLVSGLVMVALGLVLLLRPDWLL